MNKSWMFCVGFRRPTHSPDACFLHFVFCDDVFQHLIPLLHIPSHSPLDAIASSIWKCHGSWPLSLLPWCSTDPETTQLCLPIWAAHFALTERSCFLSLVGWRWGKMVHLRAFHFGSSLSMRSCSCLDAEKCLLCMYYFLRSYYPVFFYLHMICVGWFLICWSQISM